MGNAPFLVIYGVEGHFKNQVKEREYHGLNADSLKVDIVRSVLLPHKASYFTPKPTMYKIIVVFYHTLYLITK